MGDADTGPLISFACARLIVETEKLEMLQEKCRNKEQRKGTYPFMLAQVRSNRANHTISHTIGKVKSYLDAPIICFLIQSPIKAQKLHAAEDKSIESKTACITRKPHNWCVVVGKV